MSALVLAEHDNASLKPSTLNAVTAALQTGGEVSVLVAGHQCGAAVAAAAQIAGVARVLVADAPQLADQLVENVAAQVLALAAGFSHILAPSTAHGKNVMPRVAACLDVAQLSDITSVESPDTFTRPIYAGNAIATVQSTDAVKVITVRTTGFDAAAGKLPQQGEHGGRPTLRDQETPVPLDLRGDDPDGLLALQRGPSPRRRYGVDP